MTAVIREVLIKAKIVIEGDEALNKIRDNARKWNGELEKTKRLEQAVTNEQKKLTQETTKTRRAQVGLDEALGKVKKQIIQVGDAYSRGNKTALAGLDRLVRKEKELTAQIKRREDAIQRARARAQPQAGGAGRAGGIGAGLGFVAGRVSSLRAAGVVAAPVAIVAIGIQALNAWASATSKAQRLEKEFGISSSTLEKISLAVGGVLGFDAMSLVGPGGAFTNKLKDVPATFRDQAIIALENQINLERQLTQSIEARYGKEFANQKLIIQNEKQRLKIIEQQVIDTEKQTRKAVAGEFGLLSPVEIRTVLDIAQRFKKGGRGAISSEEAEKLGEFRSLQDFVAAQTAKIKDPTFDALINIAGEGRRQELKQEKQIAQTAILQANKVILDIDKGITVGDIIINATGFEDAIEKGMKKLNELVIKKFNEALDNAKAETKKTLSQLKNNHNP